MSDTFDHEMDAFENALDANDGFIDDADDDNCLMDEGQRRGVRALSAWFAGACNGGDGMDFDGED